MYSFDRHVALHSKSINSTTAIDEQVAMNGSIGERERVVATTEVNPYVYHGLACRSIVTMSLVPPKSTRMPRETPLTAVSPQRFPSPGNCRNHAVITTARRVAVDTARSPSLPMPMRTVVTTRLNVFELCGARITIQTMMILPVGIETESVVADLYGGTPIMRPELRKTSMWSALTTAWHRRQNRTRGGRRDIVQLSICRNRELVGRQ